MQRLREKIVATVTAGRKTSAVQTSPNQARYASLTPTSVDWHTICLDADASYIHGGYSKGDDAL